NKKDGDYTSIYYVARAFMKLQTSFVIFPRIIGKGDYAKHLADILIRMRHEVAVDDPSSSLSISQRLIDEIFDIKASHVEVDSSIVEPAQATTVTSTTTSTHSQSQPPIQPQEINFAVVGGVLNRVAKRINEYYEESHKAKTVVQIREFTNKLGSLQLEHQSLKIYLVAGIDVNIQNEHIEEMINRQVPLTQVLRLLCLQSLVNGRLKQKIEEHNPQDISYVYSGYAPLSVRLIKCATTKSGSSSTCNGWKGYEEVLRMLSDKNFR
ncbi:20255_t:CDS:2, partial [Cetraspora pellucida]